MLRARNWQRSGLPFISSPTIRIDGHACKRVSEILQWWFSLFFSFFLARRTDYIIELITGYKPRYCYFRGGWWEDDIGRAYRDTTLSMDFAAIIYTRTNRSMPFYVASWVERFVKLVSRGNRISVIVIVDRSAFLITWSSKGRKIFVWYNIL